jgi:fucose 4-O-acetylase-like acetyltransferase
MSGQPTRTEDLELATQLEPRSSAQLPPRSDRSLAVDMVKALAMIGVIAQHGLSGLRSAGGSFWVFQAVPILVVLFGMNMKASLDRRRNIDLRWYLHGYLPRRLERLLVPFAVTWVVAYVLGRLSGKGHVGVLALLGQLPVAGPGGYFVPVIILLTLAVPVVHAGYRRSVAGIVLAAVALDLGFEIVAPKIPVLMSHAQFLYDASPLRYLVALVAGFLVVDGGSSRARRVGGLLVAVASLAYLVLEATQGEWFSWLIPKWTRPTNLFAVPYATALTLLLVRVLPRASANPALRIVGYAGKASFHIFLVQMVWFVFHPEEALGPFLVAVAACFAIGMVFFWLEDQLLHGRRPRPAVLGRTTRRDEAPPQGTPSTSRQ